jgi:predicted DNA binding CopG/RHH family protein
MAKPMNSPKIPQTDSIDELARFWDTHDLTDFQDELEEVTEPVFERTTTLSVHLESEEAEAVKRIAKARGIGSEQLLREWILDKVRGL